MTREQTKILDNRVITEDFVLDYQDSNLDKQNQNLLCYHYTIVQSFGLSVKKRCKDKGKFRNLQTFRNFFSKKPLILQ